jgi:CheY-like chemotaxis protein
VRLSIAATDERDLRGVPYSVALTVEDTGIGIRQEKLRLIFESFQQADGTTSRRYGGTGLGLSISREIARLLGGEIRVRSTEGEGSVFTLLLPDAPPPAPEPGLLDQEDVMPIELTPAAQSVLETPEVSDDRHLVTAGDRVALIAGGDVDHAARVLAVARDRGFKGLVARAPSTAVAAAYEHRPDVVLVAVDAEESPEILERLKHDSRTRHLPVLALAPEERRHELLAGGAAAFLTPDASDAGLATAMEATAELGSRRVRTVLVVDDDDTERDSIAALIGGEDIEVEGVASSEEALARLDETRYDCIVLDLKLPKASGFSLLERVKTDERHRETPVIIHTGKALTRREETRLKRYAESIIIKDAGSPERLLDETTLALHRPPETLPPEGRRMLEQMREADAALSGRKVLIVDDDVRNVFALTSALEAHGMEVVYAENGREALSRLQSNADVDLVLMDLMMPELDGYQTTEAIRAMPQFESLPIITLTAKAMKGDREKSIAAGASDYITKPVDVDQLVSLMRVWLYR